VTQPQTRGGILNLLVCSAHHGSLKSIPMSNVIATNISAAFNDDILSDRVSVFSGASKRTSVTCKPSQDGEVVVDLPWGFLSRWWVCWTSERKGILSCFLSLCLIAELFFTGSVLVARTGEGQEGVWRHFRGRSLSYDNRTLDCISPWSIYSRHNMERYRT